MSRSAKTGRGKVKLTKRDFNLLNHALDILASDYQDSDQWQKKIDRMKDKLSLIQNQTR